MTQQKIASETRCSERQVRRVLGDLAAAGYLSMEGRPNRREYTVELAAPLLELNGRTVGDLVALFQAPL